jgi:hypothetical protein
MIQKTFTVADRKRAKRPAGRWCVNVPKLNML